MSIYALLSSPEDYMIPCLSKKFLGVDCFGCGLQRSVVLLFQGEFAHAFQMYPAIYTLIPLFVVFVVNTFFKFKYAGKLISSLAIISIAIIIINFIVKLIN